MNQDKVTTLQQEIQRFIRLFGALEQNKTPCGFPINMTQAHALYELSKVENMTQQELSEKLMIDKSSVSRLVDAFIQKEFIERAVNQANRREVLISLTEQGRNANERINQLRRMKYESLLQHIQTDQHEAVIEALMVINESLQKGKLE